MAIRSKKDTAETEYQEALKQSEERFRALIQYSADAIQLISAEGNVLYSSDSVENVLGYKPEEIQGASPEGFIHPDDLSFFMEQFLSLLQKPGEQVTLEYRIKHKNGSWVWIEATGTNYLHDPRIQAIVGNFRNITERKHQEERKQLLNAISEKLVSSLDHQLTLQEIAQLIVPAMADYCRIAVLDEQQQIREIVANHIEPEKIALVRELYEQYKDRANSSHGLQKLLETGQPELITVVTPEVVAPFLQENPAVLPIIHALGLTSYMGIPLIARDKVIGAVTFSSTQPQRCYTHDDLAFAQELARRIALTLDNAHLYAEAQKAITLRDDFISIASHELRTPVTSLKLYIQVLQKQFGRRGEERLASSFAKMDAQLNKLTLLIEGLLNVSRIEYGKLYFQEDWFDLNEVVKETVEQIQSTTSKHRIRIEGRISQLVWGDKDRIGQLLTNLLTNAVKYSPLADTIIIRLTAVQDAIVVSVQDFGIGIEKEHLNHIFDRFHRVSDPEEKTYPGLGIGLYIAREIIQRHGGTLTVESEKWKGSLFSFTLPYKSSTLPSNKE
ncbi:MAG TPA: PAS domain-containing sensor histidine kinase [Ktedonobacteraceae bacterium]|nr:PAS domain-containing sensor histidine kinase [Ktedonobacteraceae bacterium]